MGSSRRSLRHAVAGVAALALSLGAPSSASAARILELCEVQGVRDNQVVGYGLVVGLNNTGDIGQARFTLQSIAAMLRRLGATIDPAMIQTRNAAAVVVTGTLPGAANPGTRIDVNVSSLGNARSLTGGTLLQTPLFGADRTVYAVAQGPLLVGGYGARGATGSRAQLNHLTAGRVPGGGIVERRVAGGELATEGPLTLTLREPSFITARRVAAAIEAVLGEGRARALDSGTIRVDVPPAEDEDRVGLLARLQLLEVEPEVRARVVIDERTGTVVVGANVRITEAAVAQGGLTVMVRERQRVSQPNPLGAGDTVVTEESDVEVGEEAGALRRIEATASLEEVVEALNKLGASPRELIAIFQGLHRAGALSAEIEVQ